MPYAAKLTTRILLTAALSAVAVSGAWARSSDNLSNSVTSIPAQPVERTLDRHYDTTNSPRNLALNTQTSSHTAGKAQDLATFGLIGLGIIGLLWIRRHTSEL